MSYNRNAWDTQRRPRKSDEDIPLYFVPVNSKQFSPCSNYIQRSVDAFLKSGGRIKKIDSVDKTGGYVNFMALGHTSQADDFLSGQ